MLQLADHVAHAIYLNYEQEDESLLKVIRNKFDRDETRQFGLVIVKRA